MHTFLWWVKMRFYDVSAFIHFESYHGVPASLLRQCMSDKLPTEVRFAVNISFATYIFIYNYTTSCHFVVYLYVQFCTGRHCSYVSSRFSSAILKTSFNWSITSRTSLTRKIEEGGGESYKKL